MKIRWKLCFGVLGVYVAGMISSILIIGILIAYFAEKGAENPKAGEQRLLNGLTRNLKLDEEQRAEVAVVVSDILLEVRTEVGGIIDDHSPRVREVLDEDQNQRFTNFLEKIEMQLHVKLKSKGSPEPKAAATTTTPPQT